MEDRKLYHLVNGEFVHDGMPYNTKNRTYAEIAERIALWDAVDIIPELPVAESVTFTGISDGKRTDAVQASLYDAMMAEIYAERDGEKARVRNRRRADRKHPENKAERMRKAHNRLERKYGYYSNDGGLVHRGFITGELYADGKTRVAEQIARNDWKLESAEIEEYEMWEKFNAELFEFDRQWREEAKAEQERVRKAREAIEFNEWLKWA